MLGSHSVLIGEEEMPGAVREGDSALHFCEGSEGYIIFLCYPSPPQSILYLLLRVLLAVGKELVQPQSPSP